MSKVVFLVLALVLMLGSQADAGYGQGHDGTLGTQGHVSLGGEHGAHGAHGSHVGQSGYGQVDQVSHNQGTHHHSKQH